MHKFVFYICLEENSSKFSIVKEEETDPGKKFEILSRCCCNALEAAKCPKYRRDKSLCLSLGGAVCILDARQLRIRCEEARFAVASCLMIMQSP